MLCTVSYRNVYSFCDQNSQSEIYGFNPNECVKHKIWPIIRHTLSRKRCEIGCKLLLHVFAHGSRNRMYRNHWYRNRWPWMTLNGVIVIILSHSTEFYKFGANYVTVVKVRPILLRQKCSSKNLVFGNICFMLIFSEITENNALMKGIPTVIGLRIFHCWQFALCDSVAPLFYRVQKHPIPSALQTSLTTTKTERAQLLSYFVNAVL